MGSSDALDGNEKKRALRAVFEAYHLYYIIGLLYAPRIARHRIFFWNGLAFVIVDDIKFSDDSRDSALKRALRVASAMPNAVADRAATDVAIHQRGVYRQAGSRRGADQHGRAAGAGWTTSSSSGCGAA